MEVESPDGSRCPTSDGEPVARAHADGEHAAVGGRPDRRAERDGEVGPPVSPESAGDGVPTGAEGRADHARDGRSDGEAGRHGRALAERGGPAGEVRVTRGVRRRAR